MESDAFDKVLPAMYRRRPFRSFTVELVTRSDGPAQRHRGFPRFDRNTELFRSSERQSIRR
jgi:hypothetical protein